MIMVNSQSGICYLGGKKMNSEWKYMKARADKVKKIKERILEEIEKEKNFYISTLKESFSGIDHNSKMIHLLNILKEYILRDKSFREYIADRNGLVYIISDNTLDMMLTYSFSLVDNWLANFTENNDNVFNLDDFLNDNFFEHHFFSIFEKMSSAHFE